MTISVINPGTQVIVKGEIIYVSIERDGTINYRIAINDCAKDKTCVWAPAENVNEDKK